MKRWCGEALLSEALNATRLVPDYIETHLFGQAVTKGTRSERVYFWNFVKLAHVKITPSDLLVPRDLEAICVQESLAREQEGVTDESMGFKWVPKVAEKKIVRASGLYSDYRGKIYRVYAQRYLGLGYPSEKVSRISLDQDSLSVPVDPLSLDAQEVGEYRSLTYWLLFKVRSIKDCKPVTVKPVEVASLQCLALESDRRNVRQDANVFETARRAYAAWPADSILRVQVFSEQVHALCGLLNRVWNTAGLDAGEHSMFGRVVTSGIFSIRVSFWENLGNISRGATVFEICQDDRYVNKAKKLVQTSARVLLEAGHDPEGWYMLHAQCPVNPFTDNGLGEHSRTQMFVPSSIFLPSN
jgi:hypothetical protein